MEKTKKAPRLRFPGFTDDWEQRKLGDLYEINNERNKDLIGYDKTFSIATMTYKDEGNGAADSSLTNYKVLRIGDIAFEGHTNKEFRYGRFVANDVGNGIMSPRFSTLRPIKEMPVSFWKYYIHYEPVMRKILVCSTKAGTMMNELVPSDFFAQSILVPSAEEQEKIGEYFATLDNLITLHQRKLDIVKQYKQGMLQKMFPKEGEKVPEIRFPGFTGDWEQHKLKTLMDFSNGFNGDSEFYGKGIPYISVMDILNNDYITYECIRGKVNIDEKTLSRFSVEYGDVLFQRSSENVEDAGTSNVYISERPAAFGGFVIRGKKTTEYDAYFIKNLLSSKSIRRQIMSKAQGAQHINVSQEILSDVVVTVPSLSEQRWIGRAFVNLDNLITLYQRKLDQIKLYKQGLLQQMFV